MYIIDSSLEIPDIENLYNRQKEMLENGIAVYELDQLEKDFTYSFNKIRRKISDEYGIENPNSSQQVVEYFTNMVMKELYSLMSRELILYRTAILYTIADLHNRRETAETLTKEKLIKEIGQYDEKVLNEHIDEIYDIALKLIDNPVIACMYRGNGKWSSDKEAMTLLAFKGYDSAIDIMSYRKAKSFVTAVNQFKEAKHRDGRVYPKMSIGKTGRIEYKSPALMNIPKQILWEIIAPRKEGNMLISVDIKNQEPWIMINMLGIERLKDLAWEKGDVYTGAFEELFGREPETIERVEFKQSWNAMTYGATKMGIKAICRNIDGAKVYEYFNKFEQFKKYKAEKARLAKANCQMATTYFGRDILANEYNQSKLKRVLMDIPIQGTGVDILALLVSHFDDEMVERELVDKMDIYFTRKDELIIEVDRQFVSSVGKQRVLDILRDVCEHRIDDWLPFRVNVEEVGKGINEEEENVFIEEE